MLSHKIFSPSPNKLQQQKKIIKKTNVTKLKYSNCDKTQKPENVNKLKDSNWDKTQNLKM